MSERKRGMTVKAFDLLLNAGLMYPRPKDKRWTELWESQRDTVLAEFKDSRPEDQDRAMTVLMKSARETKPDLGPGEIDWDTELDKFEELAYPSYYLQPIHSHLGGWLSQSAAMNNRIAMESIYSDSHPKKSLGVRAELAKLVPANANLIIDLGAGDGDGAAAVARLHKDARIIAVEASPFMIIVGKRQNRDANLEWRHCLAEATGLESGLCDCITITLVFHECSDEGKLAIITEAHRLLRPGGVIVFSDTPPANLQTYRGFHEPWRLQWSHFNVDDFLRSNGFTDIQAVDVTAPPAEERLFTRVARKPEISLSRL